ncbi:BlaI/MecI/CopY family transcriptional regulator [Paraglaciecola hydrolytica]|uniref:CopY family transcriptional repressor n=1 Tax=Paraglaciecola hydrolytica TaxID=1799789 RepID=A0A136A1T2_9ALTE|nr:BlaI/MecI/CopY family transcriptional regulator [Paraglaciecola hydrolytica]KXI29181.1 CopY family transcriptional repressor [Paraglaciecola hydrolytica]
MIEISKTEFEVMDALWQGYPASASDIIERLNQGKDWHEKTVKTLLSRLVTKQAIDYEKQQRSYLYFPLVEKSAYLANESTSIVSRLFAGRVAPLVAGFANSENLSRQDVNELKALIDQWEKDNG